MKKILITVMSCNKEFFSLEEEIIRKTWAEKIINKQYQNIDIVFYVGDDNINSTYFNNDSKTIVLRCEDDLENTFKKTIRAFEYINSNYEYDYIFRTNTSTYVNVDLLNEFVQTIDSDDILYGTELYSLSEACCPEPLDLFARGNGILLSKKLVSILLKESLPFMYHELCDDFTIGNILNSYWIKQNKNYLSYIKGIPHGWYKCTSADINYNHKLCTFYNTNNDINFLSQFVTIQIRNYVDRSCEINNYIELHNIFKNNEVTIDTIYENVLSIYEYMRNPSIFIGSILGYIDYNIWYNLDKHILYDVEIQHKAEDDNEYNKLKKWI